MSNNAGIQNAWGRERGLEADFLWGERNCHIIRLVILSGGMWIWGRGSKGWGGRGLGWQKLARLKDGGISTKIISPQATEGGGECCVCLGGVKRYIERLGIVGVGEGNMREDTREKEKSGKLTKEILLLRYAAVELKLV